MPDQRFAPVHDDGTECTDPGAPTADGPRGPVLCGAGYRVTHIQFGGRVVDLTSALQVVADIGAALAQVESPLVQALAAWAWNLDGEDQSVRRVVVAGDILAEYAARMAGFKPVCSAADLTEMRDNGAVTCPAWAVSDDEPTAIVPAWTPLGYRPGITALPGSAWAPPLWGTVLDEGPADPCGNGPIPDERKTSPAPGPISP
jgi:hypothetical protein